MTQGQIIDQLNVMGYMVEYDGQEIIVRKDHQHMHSFYNWKDVESYYKVNISEHNNQLLYVATSIFSKLIELYPYQNIISNDFQNQHEYYDGLSKDAVDLAKSLIKNCK